MNTYFFSFSKDKQLIHIEISVENPSFEVDFFELPAWRPGRYQLQNFAKNILNFRVKSSSGHNLKWEKTARNTWKIENPTLSDFVISYDYYANEFNAGGSMINQSLVYFNIVNLTMFRLDEIDKPLKVLISNANSFNIACSLSHEVDKSDILLLPRNYYQWFDSPVIMAEDLYHDRFELEGFKFNFWFYGESEIFLPDVVRDLEKIATYQIKLFGEFPEPEYHFFLLVPESTYYHGVEHAANTVMVLGQNGILPQTYYFDLLGLASHELFHAWNIAKIRPNELLPYAFTRECYFETCFVAEGFTTYYGDRVLLESGVMDYHQYLHELETTLKRHFEDSDHASQSLLESSFDLWVDGYEKGTPHKKVSVYSKGAIAAMILDIIIRQNTGEARSLDDVMRELWVRFGKKMEKGYTYSDIKEICEDVNGGPIEDFFAKIIESAEPIFDITNQYLAYWSLKIDHVDEVGTVRLIPI